MSVTVPCTKQHPDTDSSSKDSEDNSQGSDSESSVFQFETEQELEDFMTNATTAGRPTGVTPEHLSKVWHIPHKMTEETLRATTQLNRRQGSGSLSRNLGTNDRMLRYRRIKSWFFTDTFFVTATAKSTRGYTMMQLFVSDKGYVKVYPMTSVKEFPAALRMFAKEVGAPEVLVADPHMNQKSREVKDFCNKIGTTLRILEQSTQFANRAELYIGLLKEAIRKDMGLLRRTPSSNLLPDLERAFSASRHDPPHGYTWYGRGYL